MKRWGFSVSVLALLLAAPSAGQDAPKSLLPDVFGAPPAETPPPSPTESEIRDSDDPAPEVAGTGLPRPGAPVNVPGRSDPFASTPARARSLDVVGPLSARLGGYGVRAFDGSNGLFLNEILGRTNPPLASRWAHIVLRRALLSHVPTPNGVRAADWLAARALLLLRMGEIDGAKLLVEALPLDRYTPRLYGVASQVHLAAADIPALCPLAVSAKGFSQSPLWDAAYGICAGIDGDDITAATQFDRLRVRRRMSNIDILLAERVTTVTTGEGRGANVEWDDVQSLNPFRFGLASAGGIEIPARLTERPGVALSGWIMRAPANPERRAAIAPLAAAYGIASANELAALAAAGNPGDAGDTDLRAAFAGRSDEERIGAMQRLWALGKTPIERYGRLVQTARAAARIAASQDLAADAVELVQSMLSAGYIAAAIAWWPELESASRNERLAAWPYLVLADPGETVPVGRDIANDWRDYETAKGHGASRRTAMFGAAMRALGKPGNWGDFAAGADTAMADSRYTRALDAAAKARRRGEVAILVAVGLQSSWAGVSPGQLEAVVGALYRAGFRREARMLAVEAVMRS